MGYVKIESGNKETCYGNRVFFHFSFFDAFISSAVGITVLFILYGENMTVMSVRFYIFFFIFLKKMRNLNYISLLSLGILLLF